MPNNYDGIKTQKFGIEVEMTGITRGKAAKVVAQFFNTEAEHFGGSYDMYRITDSQGRTWKIMSDASRTSQICRDLDGKVFDMADYEPGNTAPPFHVYCRTVTAPYFDDEFSLGERFARGENGKTYYAPSNMTYKEWQEKYVDNDSKNAIIKSITIDDFEDAAYGKNISDNIVNEIYSVISKAEKSGRMYINEVSFSSNLISPNGQTVLMQIEPIPAGKVAMTKLAINSDAVSGVSLDDLNKRIADTKSNLANNLTEAVIHETGHAKSIFGKSSREIEQMYAELKDKGVSGISKIALDDGAECIAEVEILLNRGNLVPDEAMQLYNKYVKGGKG